MPGKNKPKRLNRQRSWRVMRRKKRINKLSTGNPRNRKPRTKDKGRTAEVEKKPVDKVVKKVVKKTVKKVAKKAVKKVVKKEE